MEEHPLVNLGDPENLASLLGAETLDVPKGDDRSLPRREHPHRPLDALHHLASGSEVLGSFLGPGDRRLARSSVRVEALGDEHRAIQEGCAIVSPAPRQRQVGTDAMNPGPEARAPLEGHE